jgi:hypothetical protein
MYGIKFSQNTLLCPWLTEVNLDIYKLTLDRSQPKWTPQSWGQWISTQCNFLRTGSNCNTDWNMVTPHCGLRVTPIIWYCFELLSITYIMHKTHTHTHEAKHKPHYLYFLTWINEGGFKRNLSWMCFWIAWKILIPDLGTKVLIAQITNKHALGGVELSVDDSVQTVAYSVSLQDENRVCVFVCGFWDYSRLGWRNREQVIMNYPLVMSTRDRTQEPEQKVAVLLAKKDGS